MIKILKGSTYRRMQREIMELRDTVAVYKDENAKLKGDNKTFRLLNEKLIFENGQLRATQPKRGSGGKFIKKSQERK